MRDHRGRFGKGNQAARKANGPPGTTGVTAFAGYVAAGDDHGALTGSRKWTTYSNAYNVPIIATGLRYFTGLLSGTDWHAEEPDRCSARDRVRAMEIVEDGLLAAPMLRPWTSVVKKAAMYRPLGFSLHATSMRKRPDGMIVYAAIEHRPQHTITRWLRNSETEPFHTVIQRGTETGREYAIPLDEAFYCVDDTLTDGPEGVGLLRHVIEYVRRLDLFEAWEGKAYSEDLAGIPYARAPLSELSTGGDGAVVTATDTVRQFMDRRYKSEDTTPWLMLDSSVYANPDGTLSGNPKWTFDRIKTETANLDRLDASIRRIELQIARVLGVEWALMGADGAGSYAQHADKTSMFATSLQTTLTELGHAATMQLARRLIARNGLDPDTCTPRLVAEPVSTDAVLTVTQALANLSAAGLMPDDPAVDVLRKRMRLPPRPDRMPDLMTPRAPLPEVDAPETDDPTGADGTEYAPEMEAAIDE